MSVVGIDVSLDELDASLAAVVRGSSLTPELKPALLERAVAHRIDRLVAARLAGNATAPEHDERRCRDILRSAAVEEIAHQTALTAVLDAFAARGVRGVVIKGDAIAPLLYSSSYLRPRSDSDVLVGPSDRATAEAALMSLGYVRAQESSGELATFQSHWNRADARSLAHAVDLHWRLFNAEPFANVLGVDEIVRDSVAVRALGAAARAPSLEHQLIIASVHRVAHHYDRDDLLWLYDVHLLVAALGPSGLKTAARLAADRQVGPIVARALARARSAFDTPVDRDVLEQLDASPLDAHARVFLERPRQVDVLSANLAALGGFGPRVRLLREHLFPAASYMRSLYAGWPAVFLPVAYVHRIVRGVPKWLKTAR